MAIDLGLVAEDLFRSVMAPLVLGGELGPRHAIGGRAALALGERLPVDRDLASRVHEARIRNARRLAAVDAVPPPSAPDWALAAALNDMLQATNPAFCSGLRRSSAKRILQVACATIDRIPFPTTVGETLARHSWFARLFEVGRTDTTVTWWTGSRTFLGEPAPRRLLAWPDLRRVRVARQSVPLYALSPLAVDPSSFEAGLAALLAHTPLTDVATCGRATPEFAWTPSTLALVSSRGGRTLALRAIERLPAADADRALEKASAALGRAGGDDWARASSFVGERRARAAAGYCCR